MIDKLSVAYLVYGFYLYLASVVLPCLIVYRLAVRRKITDDSFRVVAEVVTDLMLSGAAAIIIKHHPVLSHEDIRRFITAVSIKLIFCVLIGIFIPILVHICFDKAPLLFKRRWFADHKYAIAFFVFFIVDMLGSLPSTVDGWCSCWYAADYSMGFGSRFLIGSILKVLYPDYLPTHVVYNLSVAVCIIIFIVVSLLLNKLVLSTGNSVRTTVLLIVLVFIVSPGRLTGLSQNLGRLENYGIMLSLLAVTAFEKINNRYIKYGVISVLTVIMLAVYQGNLFMYYPMILVPVIYAVFEDENGISFKDLVFGILHLLVTGMAFIVFQFYTYTIYHDAYEMYFALIERTDLPVVVNALDWELFKPISYVFDRVNIPFLTSAELPRESSYISFVLTVPVIALFAVLYRETMRCCQISGRSKMKCACFYYPLLLLSILPQYIFNIDWGRWMISTSILAFFELFYLIYKQNSEVLFAVSRLSEFMKTHRLFTVMTLVYIAGIGLFLNREPMVRVGYIVSRLIYNNILTY